MLFRKLYLVIFMALISAVATFSLSTPAFAETIKSYEVINNHTIKQTYVPTGAPQYAEMTRYFISDKVPSNPGQDGGALFKTKSIPSGYCEQYEIIYGLGAGGSFSLHYKRSVGETCETRTTSEAISPKNPEAIKYYFYKSDDSTIKSLTPGKSSHTFKRVSSGMPGGSPGAAYVEQGANDKCPAMLLQNGNNWGFFDPEGTGDPQDRDDAKFYRTIAKAAGYTESSTMGCKVNSKGAIDASEASLARVLGQNADYYNSSNGMFTQMAWGELGKGLFREDRVKDIGAAVGPMTAAAAIDEVADSGNTDRPVLDAGTEEECSEAGGVWNAESSECRAVDDTSTCENVGSLGWVICPAAKLLASLVDTLYGTIKTFMEINPKMFETSGDNVTAYATWKVVRNIANVAFVIAFLVVIYSQITSMGVSNYGIKKILPRLVIAAILVNSSFWISRLAIDISNLVGTSIYEIVYNQFTETLKTNTTESLSAWSQFTGWVLAGGGTALALGGGLVAISASGGVLAVLALLLPSILAALLAYLAIVAILLARQALVIMLVILSPLAFVAYLLPNTENLFHKWRKFFWSMLLIFPVIALLFSSAQLAGAIIRGTTDSGLLYVASLAISVLPLFLVGKLLKSSNAIFGKVGNFVGNPNRKPFDFARKRAERYAGRKRNFSTEKRIQRAQSIRDGKGGGMGGPGSKRRRAAAWVAGIGGANEADLAQKDKYAQAASDAATRNYVAERVIADDEYAKDLAGGDAKIGKMVKSYALQEVEQEKKKDVDASRLLLREDGKNMSTGEYTRHLREMISDPGTDSVTARAAMNEFHGVANATSVGQLTEDLVNMSKNKTDANAQHVTEVQREYAQLFKGDSRAPASVSGTDFSNAMNGGLNQSLAERMVRDINGTYKIENGVEVAENDPVTGAPIRGKVGKKYISSMDVDELKDWTKAISDDDTLPSKMTATGKQDVLDGLQEAVEDPRVNVKFGPREYQLIDTLAKQMGGSVTMPGSKGRGGSRSGGGGGGGNPPGGGGGGQESDDSSDDGSDQGISLGGPSGHGLYSGGRVDPQGGTGGGKKPPPPPPPPPPVALGG